MLYFSKYLMWVYDLEGRFLLLSSWSAVLPVCYKQRKRLGFILETKLKCYIL